ncbi:cytochrome c oxidase assembly protein [Paenibacillus montaniterrae]|uniref:cytochrome c oxidase assembly protein n=1 Tax=Paenibacillus montaniterrae TaxID=429341 RepID=UPI001BD1AD5D
MDNIHIHQPAGSLIHAIVRLLPQLGLVLLFLLALVMYILAVVLSNMRHKRWPIYRSVCWACGILLAALSVAGPLADHAHLNFTAHMLCHLFLGMLSPLLLALAAPITLFLRTLTVPSARKLSQMLKSWPSQLLTNPVVATFLNIGGLWLLYTTSLYSLMHQSSLLLLIVHLHIFLAGYLFTVSIIYVDPVSHRAPFMYRAVALIIALAGHGVLSKYIYAYPPSGVPAVQAKQGALLMYYGGDLVAVVIIFILCLHWYKATRPRKRLATTHTH